MMDFIQLNDDSDQEEDLSNPMESLTVLIKSLVSTAMFQKTPKPMTSAAKSDLHDYILEKLQAGSLKEEDLENYALPVHVNQLVARLSSNLFVDENLHKMCRQKKFSTLERIGRVGANVADTIKNIDKNSPDDVIVAWMSERLDQYAQETLKKPSLVKSIVSDNNGNDIKRETTSVGVFGRYLFILMSFLGILSPLVPERVRKVKYMMATMGADKKAIRKSTDKLPLTSTDVCWIVTKLSEEAVNLDLVQDIAIVALMTDLQILSKMVASSTSSSGFALKDIKFVVRKHSVQMWLNKDKGSNNVAASWNPKDVIQSSVWLMIQLISIRGQFKPEEIGTIKKFLDKTLEKEEVIEFNDDRSELPLFTRARSGDFKENGTGYAGMISLKADNLKTVFHRISGLLGCSKESLSPRPTLREVGPTESTFRHLFLVYSLQPFFEDQGAAAYKEHEKKVDMERTKRMTGVLSKVGSHVGKEVDNMWKKTFKTKICGWLQAALDVDNSTVCDPITLEFRRTTSFVGQKCPCKGCPFISSSYWNYVVHATYVHGEAAPAYSCCGQDIEERKALNHRRSHKSDLKKNLGCLFRSSSDTTVVATAVDSDDDMIQMHKVPKRRRVDDSF